MKGKLSRERSRRVANNKKLSKSLLTFVSALEFLMVFGICCNNFTLWKIETIVAVNRQKELSREVLQLSREVLQVYIDVIRKLKEFLFNSHFFSFRIFHCFLKECSEQTLSIFWKNANMNEKLGFSELN